MESVIQQVQGALLRRLGGLGHAVEIQLQGACDKEGFLSRGFLSHWQRVPPRGGQVPQKLTVTSSASIHGLSHESDLSNSSSLSMPSYSIHTVSHPSTHESICPLTYPLTCLKRAQLFILLCTNPFIVYIYHPSILNCFYCRKIYLT